MSKKTKAHTCKYNINKHCLDVTYPYCVWKPIDQNIPPNIYWSKNDQTTIDICSKCKAYKSSKINEINKIISWIPINDKLPQNYNLVWIIIQTMQGGKYPTVGAYIHKHTIEADEFLSSDTDPNWVDHYNNKEYAPEGWYEMPLVDDIGQFISEGDKVIYWAELNLPK